jgi:hypothetical protein
LSNNKQGPRVKYLHSQSYNEICLKGFEQLFIIKSIFINLSQHKHNTPTTKQTILATQIFSYQNCVGCTCVTCCRVLETRWSRHCLNESKRAIEVKKQCLGILSTREESECHMALYLGIVQKYRLTRKIMHVRLGVRFSRFIPFQNLSGGVKTEIRNSGRNRKALRSPILV